MSKSFEALPVTEEENGEKVSNPSSGWGKVSADVFGMAKDVATEHPAASVLAAAAVAVLGYGLFRTAFPKAVLAAQETFQPLVHFTSREGALGIARTQRLGGQWGIFGVPVEQAPSTALGRLLKTLVPRDTSQQILVTAPEAVAAFRTPPPVGPFSLARRLAGVRSSPLGSIDLAQGKFVENEIFRNGVFRTATRGEMVRYGMHQYLLDYGVDASLYGMGAMAMHSSCTMSDSQRKDAGAFRRLTCRV